ncbi:MAG TPA: hypothetical protein VF771_17500, partial [Longimicrobiaceae bacterium]
TFDTADAPAGQALCLALRRRGVRAVLLAPPRPGAGPRLCFLITAAHTPRDIDHATGALAAACRELERNRSWTTTANTASTR